MKINCLSTTQSIVNKFILELRDETIQKDRMRFRRNIERIGEVLSYEISKGFEYTPTCLKTPLAETTIPIYTNPVVLCSILRAGVPLHNGLLNYFDDAENAFISAYRHHKNDPSSFEIVVEYLACPNLEGKTLILADPMLATGQSLVATYEALLPFGTPKHIYLAAVIGAQDGINYIQDKFPKSTELFIGAIDETLDQRGYIIPGLGDAGDLAFGKKLQH